VVTVKKKDVGAGAVLILVGLLLLGSNLGTLPELEIGRLWPVVLIVIGAGKVLFPDEGSRLAGVPLLLVGGIFLAHNYHLMGLRQSWPLFVVSAGISVLAHAWQDDRTPQGGAQS
jgi:hypothetical protein